MEITEACQATWCPVPVQVSSEYRAYLELPTNIALVSAYKKLQSVLLIHM